MLLEKAQVLRRNSEGTESKGWKKKRETHNNNLGILKRKRAAPKSDERRVQSLYQRGLGERKVTGKHDMGGERPLRGEKLEKVKDNRRETKIQKGHEVHQWGGSEDFYTAEEGCQTFCGRRKTPKKRSCPKPQGERGGSNNTGT